MSQVDSSAPDTMRRLALALATWADQWATVEALHRATLAANPPDSDEGTLMLFAAPRLLARLEQGAAAAGVHGDGVMEGVCRAALGELRSAARADSRLGVELLQRLEAGPAVAEVVLARYRQRLPDDALAQVVGLEPDQVPAALCQARAHLDWLPAPGAWTIAPGERLLPSLIEECLAGTIDAASRQLLAATLARDPLSQARFQRQWRLHLVLRAAFARLPFAAPADGGGTRTWRASPAAGVARHAPAARVGAAAAPPRSAGASPMPWILGGGALLGGALVLGLAMGQRGGAPTVRVAAEVPAVPVASAPAAVAMATPGVGPSAPALNGSLRPTAAPSAAAGPRPRVDAPVAPPAPAVTAVPLATVAPAPASAPVEVPLPAPPAASAPPPAPATATAPTVARRDYQKRRDDAFAQLAAGQGPGARAGLEQAAADPAFAAFAAELRRDRACVALAEDDLLAVDAGAHLLADGRTFVLEELGGRKTPVGRGQTSRVVAVDGPRLSVETEIGTGRVLLDQRVDRLTAACRGALAREAMKTAPDGDLHAAAGLLLLAPGAPGEVTPTLVRAWLARAAARPEQAELAAHLGRLMDEREHARATDKTLVELEREAKTGQPVAELEALDALTAAAGADLSAGQAARAAALRALLEQRQTAGRAAEAARVEAEQAALRVIHAWDFTKGDAQGWRAVNGVSPLTVTGGALGGEVTADDAWIEVGGLSIPLPAPAVVEVRMRASRGGGTQLYFQTTASDGVKNGGQIGTVPGDSFAVLSFDLSANPAFSGTLGTLRIDPINGSTNPGTFAIESVKILRK